MLIHGKIDVKDLLHWRLEWKKDSEYQGKYASSFAGGQSALEVVAKLQLIFFA